MTITPKTKPDMYHIPITLLIVKNKKIGYKFPIFNYIQESIVERKVLDNILVINSLTNSFQCAFLSKTCIDHGWFFVGEGQLKRVLVA